MKQKMSKKLAIRKVFTFMLTIVMLIISCIGAVSPVAASNDTNYNNSTYDYLPGQVYIGFTEPYFGSFSNEEYPGLDVAEVIDSKKILYESWQADPGFDQNDPNVQETLAYLKSRIGYDYQLILADKTKERVWEAISILRYYSAMNRREILYIMPVYLIPYAGYTDGTYVTGSIRSYNPSQPTTITLTKNGKEMYKTIIEAEKGSGQVVQNFVFDSVEPGTYNLVVTKQAHLSFMLTDVIVSSAGVDLAQNADPKISTITLPCGDIDGNGSINSADLAVIILPSSYNKQVTDLGANPRADLAGTGKIDSRSLSIIILPGNYNKSNVVYPYK